MNKMNNNRFVRCKTKIEVIAKSTFKGSDVDVLFCILDDEVYVYQGFKMINVTLEHFANGMGIDIIEAQAIVSGGVDSIEEAKNTVKESIDSFDVEGKAKALGEAAFSEINEKVDTFKEDFKTDAKEKATDYVTNMVGDFIENTKEKVENKIEEGKSISEEKKFDIFEQLKSLTNRFTELEQRVKKLEGIEETPSAEIKENEVEPDVSENSSK